MGLYYTVWKRNANWPIRRSRITDTADGSYVLKGKARNPEDLHRNGIKGMMDVSGKYRQVCLSLKTLRTPQPCKALREMKTEMTREMSYGMHVARIQHSQKDRFNSLVPILHGQDIGYSANVRV
jgi:hypothetical protein